MNYTVMQNNFISGEISPLMEGNVSSARYQTGLSECWNFLPIRQGGLKRRPGTRYAGITKTSKKAVFIPYLSSTGEYFMLEFTDKLIRIWDSTYALVLDGASPEELVSVYLEAELYDIKYASVSGNMYLVHKSHTVYLLKVVTGTWTITEVTFAGDILFTSTDIPSCIAIMGGRLYLGGTTANPNAIYASRSLSFDGTWDDYIDFTLSEVDGTVLATHGIYLQETDLFGSKLNWLIALNRLVAGTGRSIWMDSGAIPTPATFDMAPTLYTGTSALQAQAMDNLIVYAGIGGKSLHAMAYSDSAQGFMDIDLSKDASHMLSSGVISFAIMAYPDPIIWVVCADGVLRSCTIDLQNGVVAWAIHHMGEGAVVESVAIGRSTEDILWLTVKRGSVRTVEYMTMVGIDSLSEAWYVDCGIHITHDAWADSEDYTADDLISHITYDSNGYVVTRGTYKCLATHTSVAADDEPEVGTDWLTKWEKQLTVTGLSHLEGYTVDALADSSIISQEVVASGAVTYDRSVADIIVGIPIYSRFRILRPELPANGTSQGKNRQVEKQTIRFYESLGGQVGSDLDNLRPIIEMRGGSYVFGQPIPLVTGDRNTDIPSYITNDGRVYIVSDRPLPFNVLAVMTRYKVMEA
jgi:hypothetical protein